MKLFIYGIMKEYFPDFPLLIAKAMPLIGTVLFTEFIKKYIFADFNYLIFLFVVIILDVLSKVYTILLKGGTFDWDVLFKKLGLKIFKYMIYLISMHVFLSLEVGGKGFDFGFYVKYTIYALLITMDVSSILRNLGITLPKEIQKYLNKDKDDNTSVELKDKINIQSLDEDRPEGGSR